MVFLISHESSGSLRWIQAPRQALWVCENELAEKQENSLQVCGLDCAWLHLLVKQLTTNKLTPSISLQPLD